MKEFIYVRLAIFSFVVTLLLTACSSDDGDDKVNCDVVANASLNNQVKIINKLSSGLTWHFQTVYAFGADMKPNECVIVGVVPSDYSIRFQQCNIGDGACTSEFGPTKDVNFFVDEGTIYTIEVSPGFFN